MDTARDPRVRRDAPGDTSTSARRIQYEVLRRLSVAERLALMDGLTALVQSMCREGLCRRNPGASDEELERLYFELSLGKELAAKVLTHRRAGTGSPAA
jgi:hypothetical protein